MLSFVFWSEGGGGGAEGGINTIQMMYMSTYWSRHVTTCKNHPLFHYYKSSVNITWISKCAIHENLKHVFEESVGWQNENLISM